jgi:hypothetical protein
MKMLQLHLWSALPFKFKGKFTTGHKTNNKNMLGVMRRKCNNRLVVNQDKTELGIKALEKGHDNWVLLGMYWADITKYGRTIWKIA